MTEPVPPPDHSTLESRRASARFELSEDARSYVCVRAFGAPPERVFRAFTEPVDLGIWFPSGAPEGSEMPVCESVPVAGGAYHYVMVVPGHGQMSWHGTYTRVEPPNHLDADERFAMGDEVPNGPPTSQTISLDAADGGSTVMTMRVHMPEPEDPATFADQSAAGLAASLAQLDHLVSASPK